MLQTERVLLRPWCEADMESLYKYASDPQVGPAAGWAPHRNREESRRVLHDILMVAETYAVVLKETGEAIGSISLMFGEAGTVKLLADEAELGYWIARPYWGRGLIPEAARELLRHAFETLNCSGVWCGHYAGNEQSRRVQEKCGFVYQHTVENVFCPAVGEYRTEHNAYLSRERWRKLNEHNP